VKLETEKTYVENAFLLDQVFRGLMAKANANAITVNNCMGAIMPISRTTACLTLSLLNDAGYLAFCESDFVVIPSGILLSSISGRPHFLNDPTYPHDGVITLAHCTAPRKLDGKNLEPVRLVTHFESDYGAAPKVEMKKGQKVTNVIPDFAAKRYVGFLGEIVDAPFLPICRSQIDVAYKVPDEKIALNMPGFHWETMYGDYLKEMGYALKKIPIAWECL
jgi:L-fucose isomerase-like protein